MTHSKINLPKIENGFDEVAFKEIVRTCPGHVYWKDRDGALLGCNLEQAKALGFDDIESVIGKSDFDLLDHDTAMEIRKNDLEVMNTGKTFIKEEVAVFLGKRGTFLSHKTPLRNSKGEIIGLIGVSLDITKHANLIDTINTSKDQKFYKASLTNIPKNEKDYLKSKTCIVPVSVGQEPHEGEKFRATLKMLNSYFKNCTIVVCDTLQRHTLLLKHNNKSQEELYSLSERLGSEWIERNKPIIEEELKIPYKIIRWDKCLKNKNFEENYKKAKDLCATNEQCKIVVEKIINEFYTRYKKHTENLNAELCFQQSSLYYLEELACVLEWFDEEYDYEIYPSMRDEAIFTNFSFLSKGRDKHLLHSAGIKFTKKIVKDNINFSAITLDNIIKTSPGHIYWKDKYGVYCGCNLQQAKCFNFQDTKSVIGKSDFDLLDYDVAKSIRKNDLDVMRSGRTCIKEEVIDFLGEKSTFLSHKTPLRNSDGLVIGILGVSLDITKQKEIEQQLIEKNRLLDNALKAKQIFINNISHEIRTPLSCILKMSNLLYDDWDKYPNNDARKAHLKMAVDGNNRLQSVLLNLLDLSKAQAGKMLYDKEVFSFKKSVQDVVSEFIDQQHRIHVKYSKSEDEFRAIYDHYRIEQVIRNLLANAITYGGTGDIMITVSQKNNVLTFSIRDHGFGVPQDELDKIFTIFFQSSATTEVPGGCGIGLSICKSIIEDHGGKIWAVNNKDIGSNFSFELPVEVPAEIAAKEVKKPVKVFPHSVVPKPITEARKKPVLLVIDDEPSILDVSSLVIASIGFEVITARSGVEGLKALKENADRIDVVLLDIMMPDIGGLSLLKTIKQDSRLKNLPIYIHSGISDGMDIDEAMELGALGLILKTATKGQIESILSDYLPLEECFM